MPRRALIVANDEYEYLQKLPEARTYAYEFRDLLEHERLGFVCTHVDDVRTIDEMRSILDSFCAGIEPGDDCLFWFSGHGSILVGKPLIAMTAEEATDVQTEAFSLLDVLAAFEGHGAGAKIILSDSCQSGEPNLASGLPARSFIGLANTPGLAAYGMVFSEGINHALADALEQDEGSSVSDVVARAKTLIDAELSSGNRTDRDGLPIEMYPFTFGTAFEFDIVQPAPRPAVTEPVVSGGEGGISDGDDRLEGDDRHETSLGSGGVPPIAGTSGIKPVLVIIALVSLLFFFGAVQSRIVVARGGAPASLPSNTQEVQPGE